MPRKSCRGKIAMSVSASLSMCKEAFSMTGNKSRIPRRCKETMAKVEQKQVVVNEIKEKLEKAASGVMLMQEA